MIMAILKKKVLTPAEQFKKTREKLGYNRDPKTQRLVAPGTLATRAKRERLENWISYFNYKHSKSTPQHTDRFGIKHGKSGEIPFSFIKMFKEDALMVLPTEHRLRSDAKDYHKENREKKYIKYLDSLLSKKKTSINKLYLEIEKQRCEELLELLTRIARSNNINLDKHRIDIKLSKYEYRRVKWKESALKKLRVLLRDYFNRMLHLQLKNKDRPRTLSLPNIKSPEEALKFLDPLFKRLQDREIKELTTDEYLNPYYYRYRFEKPVGNIDDYYD